MYKSCVSSYINSTRSATYYKYLKSQFPHCKLHVIHVYCSNTWIFFFSIIFANLLQSWELVHTSQTGLFQAPQAKKYISGRRNSLTNLIPFYFLKFLETPHIQGILRILLNEGWFSRKIYIKVFLYLFFPKILMIKMLLNSEEFNSKYPVLRSSPWVKWTRPPKR